MWAGGSTTNLGGVASKIVLAYCEIKQGSEICPVAQALRFQFVSFRVPIATRQSTHRCKCALFVAPIDVSAAEAAADALAKINQACSDASYLKIMAVTMGSFFLIRFIPFLGLLGIAGFWFLEFAIPFMVVRWWVKFGKIQTNDPDFRSAKRIALYVAIAVPLFFALILFQLLKL